MVTRPPPASDDAAFDELPAMAPLVSRRELFGRITQSDFDGEARISNPMILTPVVPDPPRRRSLRPRR